MLGLVKKKDLDKAQTELCELRMCNENAEAELKTLRDRVRSVENAYTEKTGLAIRNDIVKIFVKFTKVELITMLAGLYALMKNSSSASDIQAYAAMTDKLQGFIDKMEDDE